MKGWIKVEEAIFTYYELFTHADIANGWNFNFMFHNSHDKFDRQIKVSNQINQIESWRKCRCSACVWKRVSCHECSNSLPGHGTAYQCLESSVIPLSYPGAYFVDLQL